MQQFHSVDGRALTKCHGIGIALFLTVTGDSVHDAVEDLLGQLASDYSALADRTVFVRMVYHAFVALFRCEAVYGEGGLFGVVYMHDHDGWVDLEVSLSYESHPSAVVLQLDQGQRQGQPCGLKHWRGLVFLAESGYYLRGWAQYRLLHHIGVEEADGIVLGVGALLDANVGVALNRQIVFEDDKPFAGSGSKLQ